MAAMVLPRNDLKRIIRERRRMGGDRHDEVWNGVYVLMPLADNEHQHLGFKIAGAIDQAVNDPDGTRVFPGCNVSDRPEDWTKNYRCPDVAVFLPGNPAEDRGSHWLGGPDFAAEIISRHDRARKKFDFYAEVGVRELLLVGRRPWRLELHRCRDGSWELVGVSDLAQSTPLDSEALGLSFRLLPDQPRPKIEVTRASDARTWTI